LTEAVIIELQPLPGQYTRLAVLVKQMVEQVRDYPGCLQADTLLAPDRNEIAIFQRWETAEAFSDYLIWRSKQEDFAQLHTLLAAEPGFKSFALGMGMGA
jgi:quinol monooxygenase YgiN